MKRNELEGFIFLPKELTAENGAKAALIGEFFEITNVRCDECDGNGEDEYGDACQECEGAGICEQKTIVSWTTTKQIYAAAVKHFTEG